MSKKEIVLDKRYTLDMGQPVTLIPKRVLNDGIECEYVMSSPGRKELISFDIWDMNGFDVTPFSLMWMDTDTDTGRVKEDKNRNTKEIYIKYDYGNKVVSDWKREDNILFIEGVDVGLIQAEGEKDGIFHFKIFGGEYNFMCEKQDDITKWNQKRLNAIKEVIQWIDSGKQGLNNGMEEIDFIVNEWNYGEN